MKIEIIKNLYTKPQEEVNRFHDEQKSLTLKIDKHIAEYIGINDPNFIATIRRTIELYKWIQQKKIRKEQLTYEEQVLIEEKPEGRELPTMESTIKEGRDVAIKKRSLETFDSPSNKKKTDNRIRVAEMNLNKSEIKILVEDKSAEAEEKATLLYAECGCLDYGTEDTKEMISIFNAKEKFFKNKAKESTETIVTETSITSTAINIENKSDMDIDRSIDNIKLELQTSLTLWDLPADSRFAMIRRCFNHFGRVISTEWKDFNKTRAVFIHIQCRNKEKKENLQSLWSLHYEEGRLCRLTPGKFDAELLKKRKEHRAILRGLPHIALEAALLRQLGRMKAKMVFIPKNSNGNQRSVAFVYFKNNEDLNTAIENVAWYYNTRLEWSTSNQRSLSEVAQNQEKAKRNTRYTERLEKENFKPYKKTSHNNSPSGRSQGKKKEFVKNTSRDPSTSRSRSISRKALTHVEADQKTSNHDNVLEEILRRLRSIEEKQGTYVPYRS